MLTVRNARLPIVRGARVGALLDGSPVVQHVLRTDSDVNATQNDINKWKANVLVLVHQRVISGGAFSPECVEKSVITSSGDSPCLTPDENAINQWLDTTWAPWYARWKTFAKKDQTFFAWDEDEVKKWDVELAAHRRFFSEHGGLLATPVTPEFKKEVGSDGLGDPIAKVGDSIKNIVYWTGVGLLVYFGLFYIAPLFIGAASRTKQAKHDYSRIGKD